MKKPMPFEFLLDCLSSKGVIVVPAVGMLPLYANGKNVFIFRRTGKNPQHNGSWIPTKKRIMRA